MEKEKLLPLAKVLVALLCATLLAFQLKKILENYSLFRANTSIWYEANDRLLLPWVTVCPTAPHRQPKKMHFEKDYNKNTWDMEDIFHMVRNLLYSKRSMNFTTTINYFFFIGNHRCN